MTRRLILIRHAKSSWDTAELADEARPLNPHGEAAADLIGDWLASRGYQPDVALVSTAQRTMQTWERIAARLSSTVEVQRLDELYHAEPTTMMSWLTKADGPVVALVGHNPGIAGFAAALLAAPPLHADFHTYPTAATLVANFPVERWADLDPGTGEVVEFVTPDDLRRT